MSLYIGLMSGTSMDGIDVALVDVEHHVTLAALTRPYSDHARKFLQEVLSANRLLVGALSQLNTVIGQEFAAAVHQLLNSLPVKPESIVAIGSHGQTIAHHADASIPYTIQVGCPHVIAEKTGFPVVSDFRTRDLVLGGKGAPFAPIYHQALFERNAKPLAIINVGGIANVTFLDQNDQVSGYDIGPGNCLMDEWVSRHKGIPYDESGHWAQTGTINSSLLNALMGDEYFTYPAPKSIGKEYFSLAWLDQYLSQFDAIPSENVQATLLALTASSIAKAIHARPTQPHHIYLCGGGAHNQGLIHKIREYVAPIEVDSTAELNVNPDYIEAMMFAWLADKTMRGISLDLSSITGASRAAVLGTIVPGSNHVL